MSKRIQILPAGPATYRYHYSNAESNGALMAQTAGWPRGRVVREVFNYDDDFFNTGRIPRKEREEVAYVPEGVQIDSFYIDRLDGWIPEEQIKAACACLKSQFDHASDDELRAYVGTIYPEYEIKEVRVVHYLNGGGYSVPRIDFLYVEKLKEKSA
jgi:hypothetical protein